MRLPSPNPKVYIIILNYNGWGDTIECLESVLRLEYDNYQVIVVDNESTDGSVEKIKLWADGMLDVWRNNNNPLKDRSFPPVAKPVQIIELDRKQAECMNSPGHESGMEHTSGRLAPVILINSGSNLGFAGGNNVGIRYAMKKNDFQYLWLVNNDTVVNPDALTTLVERMHQKPEAGMCGSTIIYYHNPDKVQALAGANYNKWLALSKHICPLQNVNAPVNIHKVEKKLSYIVGASMLLSKRFIKDIGLMCEEYFLYFEELDWATRAKGRFRMAYAPGSIVYHKEGSSIGSNWNGALKSKLADYYGNKNKIVFTRKFYSIALPTVILSFIGVIINRIRRRQWDRVWMMLKILFLS